MGQTLGLPTLTIEIHHSGSLPRTQLRSYHCLTRNLGSVSLTLDVGADSSRCNRSRNAFVSDIRLEISLRLEFFTTKWFRRSILQCNIALVQEKPKRVFENVENVLKPGGRFATEMGAS